MLLRILLAVLLLGTRSAIAQPVPVPDCTADVALHESLTIDVVYRCRSSQPLSFVPEHERAQPFLGNFTVGPIAAVNGLVEAHYRFDLGGYARAINSPTEGIQRGKGVLMPIGGWLLEPRGFQRLPVIDIRVRAPEGMGFSSGLPRVGDAWRLAGATVRFAGYTALGRFDLHELVVPAPGSLRPGQPKKDAVLRLALLEGFADGSRRAIVDWVQRTAAAQANYWHGFTAPEMLVGLVPVPRSGVGFGRTQSGGGVTVMVEVGETVDSRRLFDDWVLVHELVHSGMPFIRGRATWFMEGSATYVEPIIRARAGWKTEEAVWKEWVMNMPQGAGVFSRGLPAASGRENYWGGAIFMLLADLAIRRESSGAKGLEDCLAGALWEGLGGAGRVSLDAYTQACDRATGTRAVSQLVERHVNASTPVALDALWKELGVALVNGRIVFDDSAPQAKWRKMIVMGSSGRTERHVKLPWES
ncbi:MAG: hypothetical protein KIS73_04630 [Enhydrobacter sp.]|nr:hypothetical protein [Enhydrobacter sp.]